ncbi:MAG: 1-deoxy-D-xylulose-5-phosphate synthase [Candidatus Obscuribacterales bacterium]|nr:1-deoxy-D-xylulose-5-phosphate synthase [Candidatus Obscuribacterales bacterium]
MSTLLNFPQIVDAAISPADIKRMSTEELTRLARTLRQDLIQSVSKTGGHLASNLGIVEITLALHKVFDSPKDKLVWDVGHQIYIHKMVTGRKHRFGSLRQYKGLSGFVTPVESEHDSFLAGHSSTSISLAVGMAIARDHRNAKNKVVAVIGDGGLTGGMALEAINHLGHIQKDVIIVLNDNEMSISENLGGFSQYMKRIKETWFYKDIKQKLDLIEDELDEVPVEPIIRDLILTVKKEAKSRIETPGIVFEKLGINYCGPIDGHDVGAVVAAFEMVKHRSGPQLVHVITQKGKGYAPAEADSIKYHGISASQQEKVEPSVVAPPAQAKPKTYSQVFTEALIDIAAINDDIVAITPATAEGSGLVQFAKVYPDRFFDVAICEQHAVTMAAGLAKEGVLPVVSIYSTFLQRAMDQVIHDVGILNLPVIFGIDRGGLVEDGETHQGVFDISHMRSVPNMRVYAPANAKELRDLLYTLSVERSGPAAIRFPRDKAVRSEDAVGFEKINPNEWQIVRQGNGPVLFAYGAMVETCMQAMPLLLEKGLDPILVNARSCKPLDTVTMDRFLFGGGKIVTLEEGYISGGFGSAVLEYAAAARSNRPGRKQAEIACIGIRDHFVEHGARNILLDINGLSPQKVAEFVAEFAKA